MLFDGSGKLITKIPFPEYLDRVQTRLTPGEFDAVVDRINELIGDEDAEIATAGWLPGSEWTGNPFWPIYEKAARRNQEVAAKMFGIVVWFVVMERPERWGSGRYEKDGRDIGSRTYFRLNRP
jgi:hypothetical protein